MVDFIKYHWRREGLSFPLDTTAMDKDSSHARPRTRSTIPRRGVSIALLLATYQRWEAAGLAAGRHHRRRGARFGPAGHRGPEMLLRGAAGPVAGPERPGRRCDRHRICFPRLEIFAQERGGGYRCTLADTGDLRRRTFLWFDIFTVNQHETAKVDQNFWFIAFRENVKDIGHTVLILSPWRNPLPLTRSWCPIFCTQDTGATFEICLSQADAKGFQDALLNKFDSIMASLCKIDVNKAQAFKKEDQEKILALLRAWLAQGSRDALEAKHRYRYFAPETHGPSAGYFKIRRPKGQRNSSGFAWTCEKTLGTEHPDTFCQQSGVQF
eukprot:g33753.t1